MTITLFIGLLTVFSAVVSLITEGIKKALENRCEVCENGVVLVVSLIVGVFGTGAAYILMGIAFTAENVLCTLLMAVAVWLCAMVGYDKVMQLIEQMGKLG